ncbi:lactoylglutathione lyase [Moraxella bovis]|uniref:Lactoylglutathione lyase n=1 Tax=Moraxella bovis TaxID=476 RepID=A0AAQ2Q5B8_MORBO|nr:lactoylglutathione lyase [Moraxella bovis]AWY19645.1 lactoylglutathione lyase [Moraxella bovis]UYZ75231.1 lactoylglutathione lyase [Moraxella bovis]UYZ78837.1 lactoylglutathione lyase [Moraxella bovis]UYZ80578.1 lactoylglutathione lyase [Moraxella bovis]UYZ87320.1 lactoylglutathione lyase [Moraxella bovis]
MTTITQPAQALTANGVKDIPTASEGFTFNHTMLRIKNPVKSLEFYTGVLGMTLLRHSQFPDAKFDLYFLAKLTADERDNLPATENLTAYVSRQRGILELTHNYGTENDADFSYHDGNSDPRGFGHICFAVPDLAKAVAWFDQNNVVFQKRPEDGSMKDIAFIKDPDGYWVEIIELKG